MYSNIPAVDVLPPLPVHKVLPSSCWTQAKQTVRAGCPVPGWQFQWTIGLLQDTSSYFWEFRWDPQTCHGIFALQPQDVYINEVLCWECQTEKDDTRKWQSWCHKVGSKPKKSNHSPSQNAMKWQSCPFFCDSSGEVNPGRPEGVVSTAQSL